jgi:DNA-binding XRE family transcriptional regulator
MFATQTVCPIDIGGVAGTIYLIVDKVREPAVGRPALLNDQVAFYVEVGRRVRLARERAGMTQDALAGRVSLSRTSVTNIEKGRQKILLHTLWNMADALGVTPEVLMPEPDSEERTGS